MKNFEIKNNHEDQPKIKLPLSAGIYLIPKKYYSQTEKEIKKSNFPKFPESISDTLASLQVRLREFFQNVKKNHVVVDNIILNNIY